jgi:hypothetical protein
MRNLCDEWARALVEDLTLSPPAWLPESFSIRPLATDDPKTRPCLLLHGTEEARSHPRLAVGNVMVELHFHRNDGTVEQGREFLRLAALEMDTRRGTITLTDAVMTWFMPAPDEEQVVEDGWIFRATRDCRFRASSVATA